MSMLHSTIFYCTLVLTATIELCDLLKKKKKTYIIQSLNRLYPNTKDECFFLFFLLNSQQVSSTLWDDASFLTWEEG